MKKLFSALFVLINVSCFAQSKWFVSVSGGPVVGGAAPSLKRQMKAQGYNDQMESTFIFTGTTSYPRGGAGAILLRGGKSITERKSLYFVAGVAETGTVSGFDAEGYSSGIFGLFAGTYGDHVSVEYDTYQLTAGYMYSFANSRAKLGFGPSIYFFNYTIHEDFEASGKQTSLVPGATFTARLPFGKERKLFGVELVFEGNMAPAAKMKSDQAGGFQPKSAAMISANLGLAFAFRR